MFHSHAGGGVDNNAIAPTREGWTEGLIMLCKVSAGTDITDMQRHAGLKGKPCTSFYGSEVFHLLY